MNATTYFTQTSSFNVTLGYNYVDLSSDPLFVKSGSMPYMTFDSSTGYVSIDTVVMATYPDVEITSSTSVARLNSTQNWNFQLRSYAEQIRNELNIYPITIK